jgi:putative ABC transport system permease protein
MKTAITFLSSGLLRRAGLAVGAILSLGLALGGAAVVTAIVDSLLVRPLPYPAQQDIVQIIRYQGPERIGPPVSGPVVLEFLSKQTSFSAAAGVTGGSGLVPIEGRSITVRNVQATPGYFDVIGMAPQLGRWFSDADLANGDGDVVVLSDAFWKAQFGGRAEVLGQTLNLLGRPHRIIGIAPPGMRFEAFGVSASDVVSPLILAGDGGNRGGNAYLLWGRLAPGSSIESAQSEMTAFAGRLAAAYPDNHAELRLEVESVVERFTKGTRRVTTLFGFAVGLLLLVGTASVTNLVLAHVFGRRRETATRIALGARGFRLFGALLGEVMLIVTLAAGIGLLAAHGVLDVLMSSASSWIIRADEVRLGFGAMALTLVVAWIIGLVVALVAGRSLAVGDLAGALRGGARSGLDVQRQRIRRALVAAQIALSLVLLLGSALLSDSLRRLGDQPLGFDPAGLVAVRIVLPFDLVDGFSGMAGSDKPASPSWALVENLQARLAALPGVTGVGAVMLPPVIVGGGWNGDISVVGDPPPPAGRSPLAEIQLASSGYLELMGLRVVQGRGFTGSAEADAGKVIVNRSLVEALFGNRDPIGRKLNFVVDDEPIEIIGVIEDVRQNGLDAEPRNEVLFPMHVGVPTNTVSLMLRASSLDQGFLDALRRSTESADARIAVDSITTMDAALRESMAERRFLMLLMGLLGLTALGIAMVGLYAMMGQAVAQRSGELGVRMALGATPGAVFRLVMGEGLRLLAIGIAMGLLIAWQGGQLLSSWLYDVSPMEPGVVVAITVLLVLVAIASLALPAFRASRVAPSVVLRQE